MTAAQRLRQAGLVAALGAAMALACGSDVIDLLPPASGLSGGAGTAGSPVQAGMDTEGGKAGSDAMPQAGSAGSGGTSAGGGSGGVSVGGFAGCSSGFNCGGFNDGFGGGFGCINGPGGCISCSNDDECPLGKHCSHFLGNICVQCADKGQCRQGYTCDRLVGRCGKSCESTIDCDEGHVCDMAQGTCVSCFDNRDCEQDPDPDTRFCVARRCVECMVPGDCIVPGRPVCAAFQCVECAGDDDCGGRHCDIGRGQCE
jgi:hypothetical protein